MENYFAELNSIDVSAKVEKKNGLSYLSWAWAWGELKKRHPDATYTIYESAEGMFYHSDGQTCWVKTGVTVNGIEHIEYLPVMDYKNKSIPVTSVTSFDVNKAIQRSLTKAVARHGLGLYIYAGEDLPESADDPFDGKPPEYKCVQCGKPFVAFEYSGKIMTPENQYKTAIKQRGKALCKDCYLASQGKPDEGAH